MDLSFWAATDIGRKRTHNEDNFLVDQKLSLFVVADGMGGHASGEIASQMAVNEFRGAVDSRRDIIDAYGRHDTGVTTHDVLGVLEYAVQTAGLAIFERGQKEPEKRGMGTTISAFLLSDSIAPPASATSWIKLQPEEQAADLVTAAVAMQPEYLIVDAKHSPLAGEVLGECNLGLEGGILAIVARSANDALHRMQLLSSTQGAAATIGADIVASSVDLIVQASVLSDGALKVVEMAEPKASLDGQLSAHALFTWIPGDDNAGSFTVTGARSALATQLSSSGSSIPTEILNGQ